LCEARAQKAWPSPTYACTSISTSTPSANAEATVERTGSAAPKNSLYTSLKPAKWPMSDSHTVAFTTWSSVRRRPPGFLDALAGGAGLGLDIALHHLAGRAHRHLPGKEQETTRFYRAGKRKRQAAGKTLNVIAHGNLL
jgi:hypothetical protein